MLGEFGTYFVQPFFERSYIAPHVADRNIRSTRDRAEIQFRKTVRVGEASP